MLGVNEPVRRIWLVIGIPVAFGSLQTLALRIEWATTFVRRLSRQQQQHNLDIVGLDITLYPVWIELVNEGRDGTDRDVRCVVEKCVRALAGEGFRIAVQWSVGGVRGGNEPEVLLQAEALAFRDLPGRYKVDTVAMLVDAFRGGIEAERLTKNAPFLDASGAADLVYQQLLTSDGVHGNETRLFKMFPHHLLETAMDAMTLSLAIKLRVEKMRNYITEYFRLPDDALECIAEGGEGVSFKVSAKFFRRLPGREVEPAVDHCFVLKAFDGACRHPRWADKIRLLQSMCKSNQDKPKLSLPLEIVARDNARSVPPDTVIMFRPYVVGETWAHLSATCARRPAGSELVAFVRECREANVTCQNVSPRNFVFGCSGLTHVDIGMDIEPWSEEEEALMCRKLFLMWRFFGRVNADALETRLGRVRTEPDMPDIAGWEILVPDAVAWPFTVCLDDIKHGRSLLAQYVAALGEVISSEIASTVMLGEGPLHHALRFRLHKSFPKSRILTTSNHQPSKPSSLADVYVHAAIASTASECSIASTLAPLGDYACTCIIPIEEPWSMTPTLWHLLRRWCGRAGYRILPGTRHVPTIDGDTLMMQPSHVLLRLEPLPPTARQVPKTSLLIKACAMEHALVKRSVRHLVTQLDAPRPFDERIVVVDSRRVDFVRAHGEGDMDALLRHLGKLKDEGWIDKVVVCDGPGGAERVLADWFGVENVADAGRATHAGTGVPVISFFEGLDACEGEVVLQVDLDLIVGRTETDHSLIDDAMELYEKDRAARTEILSRRKCDHRPDNRLKVAPNDCHDSIAINLLRSLVEISGNEAVPSDQRGAVHCDRAFKPRDWNVALRRQEPYVVVACGGGPLLLHAVALRGLMSLMQQRTDLSWGCVVMLDDMDDDRGLGAYVHSLCGADSRFSVVRTQARLGSLRNTCLAVRDFIDGDAVVVTMDLDDQLASENTLDRVFRLYERRLGLEVAVGGMGRLDRISGMGEIFVMPEAFEGCRSKRSAGKVWTHLRSFRRSLFMLVRDEDLRGKDGHYYDQAADWAFMVPMCEMAREFENIDFPAYHYSGHLGGAYGSEIDKDLREKCVDEIIARPMYARRRWTVAVVGYARIPTLNGIPDGYISEQALTVGKLLATAGMIVVTGGMQGVMELACRGAKLVAGGPPTVGIIPGTDPSAANPFVDVVIPSGLGDGRNKLVASSDAVVVVGGGAGTASEVSLAWSGRRLVIALKGTGGIADTVAGTRPDPRVRYRRFDSDDVILAAESPEEVGCTGVPTEQQPAMTAAVNAPDEALDELFSTTPPPFGRAMLPLFAMKDGQARFFGGRGLYILTKNRPLQARSSQQWVLRLHPASRIDENPDLFYKYDLHAALDEAIKPVADILAVDVDDLVFVNNATAGTNAALRSVRRLLRDRGQGVETPSGRKRKILQLSCVYLHVGEATAFTADLEGLEVLTVDVEWPISEAELVDRVRRAIDDEESAGGSIAIAMMELITSLPGVINPLPALLGLLRAHDIFTVVDAAHAIGQVPLRIGEWDVKPDLLVTNLHKWLHTPRGSAVLYLGERWRGAVTHPITSGTDVADWRAGYHGIGTIDWSAFLAVRAAVRFREWIGGERAIMARCHDLAVEGGRLVADMWGTEVMLGPGDASEATTGEGVIPCMVNVRAPRTALIAAWERKEKEDKEVWALQGRLLKARNMTAQFFPHKGRWWVRFSAQVYNELRDFEEVGGALLELFEVEGKAASTNAELGREE
ncbi:hypothetical protein HK101_010477 [Irineochytrium annulatum]|nr:hypothetical protein HK101_010477 [Irineochytrium annulatum]